jgi:hypothetical protein
MSEPIKPHAAGASLAPLAGPSYHAVVIETGNGFKVRPPAVQVNGQLNPFFRFKNSTRWTAWLFLPPAVVKGAVPPFEVPAGLFVEVPLTGGGTFSYVVVLATDSGIISVPGESDPVIIIDPPAN